MKILVMGDAHISETDDLKRFKGMAVLIKKELPDIILSIGDMATMACLSDWDKNKKKIMEGKRFANEIKKLNEAWDIIQAAVKEVPNYNPQLVYLEGNHEHRVERYLEINPTFDGVVNIPVQLNLKKRNIIWSPYKEVYDINGISFTHIPIAGNGRPIGGANIAKSALDLFSNSVVFGHIHRLEIMHKTRHNSETSTALSVGCFFEEEDDYVKGTVINYWKGLIMLETTKNNEFDIKTFSMKNIIENYENLPTKIRKKKNDNSSKLAP